MKEKKLETLLRETKEIQKKKHDKQTTDKQTNNSC